MLLGATDMDEISEALAEARDRADVQAVLLAIDCADIALDDKRRCALLYSPMKSLRRFLTFTVFAFWMGGFTFYAGVVIPTAHEVLGSHREVGFITQQVTRWINLVSLLALALLTWNLIAERRGGTAPSKRLLRITLGMMAATQIALFAEHPILDRMLDVETQNIASRAHFYTLHRVYLLTAAVQWLAAMLHGWMLATAGARGLASKIQPS